LNPPLPAESEFTLRQRLALRLIAFFGVLAIRLIGPTLRYEFSYEEGAPSGPLAPAVYAFWHQCVFAAAWLYRKRQVAVMTSQSFDGEYIARIIERLGFRAVRGSSSRGAVGALLGMRGELESGRIAAFTIDGPRGPRFIAKPGPVFLASQTGLPLVVFHIALASKWQLHSWDQTAIPRPFSRAHVRTSKVMQVPENADDATLARSLAEMQQTLERIQAFAEAAIK